MVLQSGLFLFFSSVWGANHIGIGLYFRSRLPII